MTRLQDVMANSEKPKVEKKPEKIEKKESFWKRLWREIKDAIF